MKKILVMFTGGTIGSMRQGEEIDVLSSGSYMILEEYKRQYECTVTFETTQPLNILSENMLPKHWVVLAESLHSIDYGQYDGIILTHGSDTLAYTAAMLSYLFAHIPIPLILIASNYPIDDARSNGLRNFANAVGLIEQTAIRGIFSIYEDQNGVSNVYLGSRIMQCEPFTDQFRSPYDLTYGQMENGRLVRTIDGRNPSLDELRHPKSSLLEPILEHRSICSDIVYIKPYPGLKYDYYQWSEAARPKAIVHDLYHSGTACASDNEPYSLIHFMARCRDEGIPVFLCPVKIKSEALYASTGRLVEAGGILTEGISVEALITKLMLGYTLYENEAAIDFVMKRHLYFEFHLQ